MEQIHKKSYDSLKFLRFLFNFSGKGQTFIALNETIFNAYMTCYLVHTIANIFQNVAINISFVFFGLFEIFYFYKEVDFKQATQNM